MPQLFMIIDPASVFTISAHLNMKTLAAALIGRIEEVLGIEGHNDVAFTAIQALYTRGEADVQLEVRYTAGEDECGREELVQALIEMLRIMLTGLVTDVSVRTKSYNGGVFKKKQL